MRAGSVRACGKVNGVAVLRSHAPIAQQMIRKLLRDRIVFTPDPSTRIYRFRFPGDLYQFFSGLVCPQALASHSIPSWNQFHDWLRTLAELRESMGTAA
jgi:hypothetical protein